MPLEVRVPQMAKVVPEKIDTIVCNRLNSFDTEQYMVKWKGSYAPSRQPYSWHTTYELSNCLPILQDYLETISSDPPTPKLSLPVSKFTRSFKVTTNGTPRSIGEDDLIKAQSYNCSIVTRKNQIYIDTSPGPSHYRINGTLLPTPIMLLHATQSRTITAAHEIRLRILSNLRTISPPITLLNTVDQSSLSLRFEFVEKSILGPKVRQADADTVIGCQKCGSNMATGFGCDSTAKCACLEFAAVDESRLTNEQRRLYTPDGDTQGFPKNFPYYASGDRARCLVPFYLDQRHVIYECNDRCKCGSNCKSRVVQHGRSVPLTVFRTHYRGWGLKTPVSLLKGQFIDTYRGEILTNADTTEREKHTGESDPSYMYTLDKFSNEYLTEEDFYVVDGKYKGSPIRFMNHSCDPNCRVFVVSYNKYDYRIYDLAMFACRPIKAGEELTFDYLDRDNVPDGLENEEEDENESKGNDTDATELDGEARSDGAGFDDELFITPPRSKRFLKRKSVHQGGGNSTLNTPGRGTGRKPFDPAKKPHPRAVPCLCGSSNCRRWLWT